jgi:hypothetical protein
MKKRILRHLSICAVFLLFFMSCKSFLPNNTTVTLQSQRLNEVNLTEKRVLVVSYDDVLVREFAISLKNYVREELKTHKIAAERINIRQKEVGDVADFEKLTNDFKPDYLLTIHFKNERTRDFYMVGRVVKKLRGMTAEFNLTHTNGQVLWKTDAIINHFYDNEGVVTSKKIAKQLGINLKKDAIIE